MALNNGCIYESQILPGEAGRTLLAHLAAERLDLILVKALRDEFCLGLENLVEAVIRRLD